MRSSRAWECPSTIVRQGARQRNGKEGYETQGDTGPEVRGAAAQPLPAVRQGARLYAYVRYVPLLLPQACPRGQNTRRRQIELVA